MIEILDESDKMDTTSSSLQEMVHSPTAGEDEACNSKQNGFLEQFIQFVALLKSLNLLHCIADHAVADVIHMKVRGHKRCIKY